MTSNYLDHVQLADLIGGQPTGPEPRAVSPPGPVPAAVTTVQISLRLPEDLLGHFDFIADRDNVARSELIRVAMVEYLRLRAEVRANSATSLAQIRRALEQVLSAVDEAMVVPAARQEHEAA